MERAAAGSESTAFLPVNFAGVLLILLALALFILEAKFTSHGVLAVGGVVAMGVSVLIFAVMPFMDRSKIPGGAHYRPIYRVLFFIFLADVFLLGWVGAQPVGSDTRSIHIMELGRAATGLYFATFLLLPFISKLEESWMRKRGLPPALQALFDERTPRQDWHHEEAGK